MPGRCGSADAAGSGADRRDRVGIGAEVALGVMRGAGALAEHVEGVAEFRMRTAARQSLGDGLAEHEMRADQPHRLAGRGAHRRASEPAHDVAQDALRRFVRPDHPGRDAERPRRGRDQQGGRAHLVGGEISGRELVLDEAVGSRAVGHPQQRFGEHHQREALLGGERVLVQEVLDAADAARPGADRLDEGAGAGIDALLRLRTGRGRREEPRGELLVGRRIGGTERMNATFHGFLLV